MFRTEGPRFPEAGIAFSWFGSPPGLPFSERRWPGARMGEAFSISPDRVRAGEDPLGPAAQPILSVNSFDIYKWERRFFFLDLF